MAGDEGDVIERALRHLESCECTSDSRRPAGYEGRCLDCQTIEDLIAALRAAREDTKRLEEFEYYARMVVDGQLTETERDRSVYRRGFRRLLAAMKETDE